MSEPWASYLILGGPVLVCLAVGLWHWRTHPRWYSAYLVWTVAFALVTNITSFGIEPSRYAGGKFFAAFVGSLVFCAGLTAILGGAFWVARPSVRR